MPGRSRHQVVSHGSTKNGPYLPLPIASMYGVFTYIWLICTVIVGKYTSPMDAMGYDWLDRDHLLHWSMKGKTWSTVKLREPMLGDENKCFKNLGHPRSVSNCPCAVSVSTHIFPHEDADSPVP